MTRLDLLEKAGVGCDLPGNWSRSKQTIRLDKVTQVLQLFSHTVASASCETMDAYQILLYHLNKRIRVSLKNKTTLTGFIMEAINEYGAVTEQIAQASPIKPVEDKQHAAMKNYL